jgi:hypothetical protein
MSGLKNLPKSVILGFTDALLPNIKDNHIDHKQINWFGKGFANKKLYYSVDMNTWFEKLSIEDTKSKMELVNTYLDEKSIT